MTTYVLQPAQDRGTPAVISSRVPSLGWLIGRLTSVPVASSHDKAVGHDRMYQNARSNDKILLSYCFISSNSAHLLMQCDTRRSESGMNSRVSVDCDNRTGEEEQPPRFPSLMVSWLRTGYHAVAAVDRDCQRNIPALTASCRLFPCIQCGRSHCKFHCHQGVIDKDSRRAAIRLPFQVLG